MRFEQIDIITFKKQAVIDTCKNIIISIEIHLQDHFIKHIIHIKLNIVISSHTEQFIFIHHIQHLFEQDFLFESENSLNLMLFVHMINFSLSVIIAQNEINQHISIRHN